MSTYLSSLVLDPEAELKPLKNNNLEQQDTGRVRKNELPQWRQLLERRIYILTWIKTYDQTTAVSDMIAGITLGLTMIPQSIAYAALAGLPSQYGLYSAFIGSLAYVFFGTVKQVSIGPSALMSLMTLQYTMDKPPEFAAFLAFCAGFIEVLMGVLNLGFIVSFISIPVTNAFTSATALIVAGAQLKNLLGIKYSSKGFSDSIYELIVRIGDSQISDFILGIICCTFLLSFKQITAIPIKTAWQKKGLWYLSISRNAIIVIITSFIAYRWSLTGGPPFKLSGKVAPGVPSFNLPPFQIEYKNHTAGFIEIAGEIGSGIVVVPVVAVLANIAIAKAFSTGAIIDAKQEMLALGICNLLGSCFKSMPTCGAFSRSAVSQASGIRTPMAGLYSGFMTVLALSLLTPYFYFIPRASLASVLITAVIFMVDIKLPVQLWRKNRQDFWAWFGTLIVCLAIGVELGLLFGIFMNVLYLLYLWAYPEITILREEIENIKYIHVIPYIGMFFPSADNLREKVNQVVAPIDFKIVIVLDCIKFTGIDYTAAQGINLIAEDLAKQSKVLIVQNLDVKLQKFISTENLLICNKGDNLKDLLRQNCEINDVLC